MRVSIRGRDAIRHVKRVRFDDDGSAGVELLDDMVDYWPVKLHLMDVDPIETLQVLRWRLEEGPLIAFKIDSACKRHGAGRINAEGVQQFDPNVDVAIRFGKSSIGLMQGAGRVASRIETKQAQHDGRYLIRAGAASDHRFERTSLGQP